MPLPNVSVTLFEATAGQPTVLGKATTNVSGQFIIASPTETSSSIFFVSAHIEARVAFVAVLGPKLPSSVTVNELTTVAAGYSLAPVLRDWRDIRPCHSFGLGISLSASTMTS